MSYLKRLVLRARILSRKFGLYPFQGFIQFTERRALTTSEEAPVKYKTMKEIKEKLMEILGIDCNFSKTPKSRHHLMQYLPKSQEEIPVRTMDHSFDSAIIPLSSEPLLKEMYDTHLGGVRIGRLIEDVDTFAVWCCTKHLIDPNDKDKPFPYIVATVLVDRIDMLKSGFKPNTDIRLSGHVCWVGKSSMEVGVRLCQKEDGVWKEITRAWLVMAARNSLNTGPGIVNAIEAVTEEHKAILRGAEERKLWREKKLMNSILKKLPTQEELLLIQNLFMKTVDSRDFFLGKRYPLPPKSKWMPDTTLNNFILCHPEVSGEVHRNMHNKIFGGFLMRQALELSWLTGLIYGSRPPQLVKISDIGFFQPVDVGSLVRLDSSITYTEGEYLQIFVYAEVFTNRALSDGKNTTSFNFTYYMGKDCDTVYPSTYLDAMKFIEGRRNFYDATPTSLELITD